MIQSLARHHDENHFPRPEKLQEDHEWFSACLANLDGKDVGYVAWNRLYDCRQPLRKLELQHLYVVPEFRGQGLGKKLIACVIRAAQSENCAEVVVCSMKTNTEATALYRKIIGEPADRGEIWKFTLLQKDFSNLESALIA